MCSLPFCNFKLESVFISVLVVLDIINPQISEKFQSSISFPCPSVQIVKFLWTKLLHHYTYMHLMRGTGSSNLQVLIYLGNHFKI